MKRLSLVGVLCLLLAGCSAFSSGPTATIEKLHAYAEKGDVASMTKLFSSHALRETGESTINKNNQNYSDLLRKAAAAGLKAKMYNVKETVNGDKASVAFLYGEAGKDSMRLSFDLIKENGEWKIDLSKPE
jgi:hypothetical protein